MRRCAHHLDPSLARITGGLAYSWAVLQGPEEGHGLGLGRVL